jgi:hypothetical protein
MKNIKNILGSLSHFGEWIPWQNYKSCDSEVDTFKSSKIISFNDIFVLQLNLFEYNLHTFLREIVNMCC